MSQRIQGGGMWNSQRPTVSNETQNLLKTMMQESKLTNFQQRTLNSNIKSGQSLPRNVAPTHTIVNKRTPQPKAESKRIDPRRSDWVGTRKLDEIVDSGAYEKSDYKPVMRKAMTDQDKEHLGKIMAYGKDAVNWPKQKVEIDYDIEEPEEIDRFDELKSEVNERVEFLDSMSKLGRRKEYQTIIMTEISQKIREMELLDKTRTAELNELIRKKENSM